MLRYSEKFTEERLIMEYNALFIGSSTKDIIMLVDAPPESDQRISASRYTVSLGGVASTAAAAHQKLGGSTAMITIVGKDETGEYIAADLNARHYAWLQLLHTDKAPSSISMIQVEQNGKRCITHYGGCIKEMTFERLDLSALPHSRFLHLGVMNPDLMLRLARYCKEETNALLSIDGGNISKDLADELLPFADIFIPDHKTAMKTLGLAPREACSYYVEHGAGFAAVTAAENGVVAYDGTDWYQAPAIHVNLLDTLGAGDNFHGAFLYAMSQDWDMNRRLFFSNIFASLSCEGLGGRSAAPSLETVLKKMEEIPSGNYGRIV
ncbi:MAG: PfkB family carbohydrate kinase [Lachnospiraceae bacterium]|nr:PfkB family carbohydrate kinase [Lachnospiraceae bacterium]